MIDKLYLFSEISSKNNNTEVLDNIDNEKKIEWTIDNKIKDELKKIHLNNKYIEKEEEIEITNKITNIIEKKKYKIQIDNEFIVNYNYNLIENKDIKNYNNKLILKDGYYYYIYIYKYNNKIFFDTKDHKLNLISSKSNPILGAKKEYNSMIIEHNINYNYIENFESIGIMYLYRPLETLIKNNIYIIDIIYYNTIIKNITNYKLNVIFYNLEHYFNLKENIDIDTNQSITDDIKDKLKLNYKRIYDYVKYEKKYLQINKLKK